MSEQISYQSTVPLPEQNQSPIRTGSNFHINPNLLRINADDQNKKTLCIFWSLLVMIIFVLGIIATFGVPRVLSVLSKHHGLKGTNLHNCSNPSGMAGNQLLCVSFKTDLTLGAVISNFSSANQFVMVYLKLLPNNLNNSININQNIIFQLYSLSLVKNSDTTMHMLPMKKLAEDNVMLTYPGNAWKPLYGQDGNTQLGYTAFVGVITKIDNRQTYLVRINFTKSADFNSNFTIQIQNYMINSKFTYFTIIVRYFFFVISVITCILYFYRYIKIPKQHRIIQQKMIAIGSVLLLMFNDPLYPLTILQPNHASSFFSILFICNLVVFIILIWLVFVDRIAFQDGKKYTQQLTKQKIVYCVVLWIMMIAIYMRYAMYQINVSPIIPRQELNRLLVAEMVVGITAICGIGYVVFRLVRICMGDMVILWRSSTFLLFSVIFILSILVMICTSSLMIFNYSGQQILITYGLINTYVIYLQYMFSITGQQMDNISDGTLQMDSQHDGVTVGTIDIVEVDLRDQGEDRMEKDMGEEEVTNQVDGGGRKQMDKSQVQGDYNVGEKKQKYNQYAQYQFDQ